MNVQLESDSSSSDEGLDTSLQSIYLPSPRIFNDIIHPHMEIPHLCSLIINTPQFERLRNLKQLGVAYYVYPTASHNRFEHCIGTCYLAGKYVRSLQRSQPDLQISSVDILCVEIAGLCHDIGHGPFSHTWEHFMHEYSKDYSHEVMSIRIIDSLIKENNLQEQFELEGITETDIIFIKEMILGHPLPGNDEFKGREPEKYFLYQIVSNSETKVDVDKFDYLLRDCRQLNLSTSFDYQRVMDNSRVVRVKNGTKGHLWKIAYRKKINENLEDLFKGRYRMHTVAYQHRVIKIIEEMLIDGLKAAEPFFKVTASDGTIYKLSTAYKDLTAFLKLTDSVFEQIVNWGNGGESAALIFRNISRRKLYSYIGFINEFPENGTWSKLVQKFPALHYIPVKLNYGQSSSESPLNSALFYEKSNPNLTFKMEFPPSPHESRYYIVYRKMEDATENNLESNNLDAAKKELEKWAESNSLEIQTE